MLTHTPYLLYSDGKGNIFEDTTLFALGRAGWDAFEVELNNWIELPDGGNLYELPVEKLLALIPQQAKCVCAKRVGL